eukprot:scaffold7279_cov69-Cylindrotheca_fusiformis.AAC.2
MGLKILKTSELVVRKKLQCWLRKNLPMNPPQIEKQTAEIIDESSDEEAIVYDFSQKEEFSFAQWDK